MSAVPFESKQQVEQTLKTLQQRIEDLRGIFDYEEKKKQPFELRKQLECSEVWQDPKQSAKIQKHVKTLTETTSQLDYLKETVDELADLWVLAKDSDDEQMQVSVMHALTESIEGVEAAEFCRMFTHEQDASSAFLEIQSGSGGTEAQDWADMLFRMYCRWADSRGFKVEVLDYSAGEVAGIKGATIKLSGQYAYGWARTETGIHRLVRKSPFDSGNRRQPLLQQFL